MMIQLLLETVVTNGEEAVFQEIQINGAGWLMLLIGVVVLYGGVALCLFRAMGAKVHQYTEEDEIVEDFVDLNEE